MKKTTIILILAIMLIFASCSGNSNDSDSENGNTPSVQTIPTVTENTKMPESISKTDENGNEIDNSDANNNSKAAGSNKASDKKATDKKSKTQNADNSENNTGKNQILKAETSKNAATTKLVYEMRIGYSSLKDFEAKVSTYKEFSDLMKSVNSEKNNVCVNPFKQENLPMIFEDKKAFSPILPKDYKFNGASLSSRNFFEFNFTEKNGDKENIVIYVNSTSSGEKKLKRSFESDQGTVIYKNSNGNYCWFLDGKYLVVYSGNNKDFINNLYFKAIYFS